MLSKWKSRDGDAVHADGAFQFQRLYVRVTRWRVILLVSGMAAYAVALAALTPAEAVVPEQRDAVGTVWDGQAALAPGFGAGWTAAPLRSLAALGLALDGSVEGPATALTGRAVARPGSVRVLAADGLASMRLLSAMGPGIPFACDADVAVAAPNLAPPGEGQVRIGAGVCAASGGSVPLPPLTGELRTDVEGASLGLRTAAGLEVAQMRIADGRLSLTVPQAGVGVIPGVGAPATLETPL